MHINRPDSEILITSNKPLTLIFRNNKIECTNDANDANDANECQKKYVNNAETDALEDSSKSDASSRSNVLCPYCRIKGIVTSFDNVDLLERHSVQRHPGWSIHSQFDIEKFERERSS
jgi:TATA-box binding protein (TBP) (component of TFIID and TFIIIB)